MDFSIISKYRGELMGIGILDVLLLHFFTLNNVPVHPVIRIIINLVFVQGFLFLSGFGLYYSFTNDNSLRGFYKRRFMSVMIPYLVIALPYYTYFLITNQLSLVPIYSDSYYITDSPILIWLGRITTLGYWFEGNFNGMWYLALTVILYLLFPFIYKLFRWLGGGGKNMIIWLIIIILTARIGSIVSFFAPRYWQTVSISLPYIYFFLIGMIFGKWSYYKEPLSFDKLVVFAILYWIAPHIQTITAMIIICYMFYTIRILDVVRGILRWFGSYSLEIYVLHLSLYSLFVVLEENIALAVPYYHNFSLVIVTSLLLAVFVKKVSNRIKTLVV